MQTAEQQKNEDLREREWRDEPLSTQEWEELATFHQRIEEHERNYPSIAEATM